MKSDIEKKLTKTLNFWHQYVSIYSFCRNKKHLKYTERGEKNYINSIIGYILDVNPIIFTNIVNENSTKVDNTNKSLLTNSNRLYITKMIADNISFLQSVYIQQDLMRELLYIFKKTDEKLNNDDNYTINRDIRNELVGHPLGNKQKTNKNTTVFSYDFSPGVVEYLKYAKENNYKLSIESFKTSEVKKRHAKFMNTYLDKILLQIHKILSGFKKHIETCIEPKIDKLEFPKLLGMISNKYEGMLNNISGFHWYDKIILLEIYNKKDSHPRYQNVINKFIADLKNSITQTKKEIDLFITEQKQETDWPSQLDLSSLLQNISTPKTKNKTNYIENISLTNLSKLYSMENVDFDFQVGFLKDDCEKKPELKIELEHMKSNIGNKLEYYSAYYYAEKLLS